MLFYRFWSEVEMNFLNDYSRAQSCWQNVLSRTDTSHADVWMQAIAFERCGSPFPFSPWPGSYSWILNQNENESRQFKVWLTKKHNPSTETNHKPGTIIDAGKSTVLVAVGAKEVIELVEVQFHPLPAAVRQGLPPQRS